jgi:ABC-type glycerol-3-phosphate transport system substrate-binding protein
MEDELIGDNPKFREAIARMEKYSRADKQLLLLGETGTGKEVFARASHDYSPRSKAPFVVVNCGGLAKTLLESELFGHEKGAFTGASEKKEGSFKAADQGTLFLDEIGEMPTDTQATLLRVLESQEVTPVGSNTPIKVNVRVIAATNRDLDAALKERKLRADLYYRLNKGVVTLPPLRQRMDDLPQLAEHFIRKFSKGHGNLTLAEPLRKVMEAYDWPGNVRQLRHAIEVMVVQDTDGILDLDDWEEVNLPPPEDAKLTPAKPDVALHKMTPDPDVLSRLFDKIASQEWGDLRGKEFFPKAREIAIESAIAERAADPPEYFRSARSLSEWICRGLNGVKDPVGKQLRERFEALPPQFVDWCKSNCPKLALLQRSEDPNRLPGSAPAQPGPVPAQRQDAGGSDHGTPAIGPAPAARLESAPRTAREKGFYTVVVSLVCVTLLLLTSVFFGFPFDWRGTAVLKVGLPRRPESSGVEEAMQELRRLDPRVLNPRFRFEAQPGRQGESYDEAAIRLLDPDNYHIVMLDDVWIARQEDSLVPFDEIDQFGKDKEWLLANFHQNLIEACKHKGKLLGLPILGNVQVLLFQKRLKQQIHDILGPTDERGLRVIHVGNDPDNLGWPPALKSLAELLEKDKAGFRTCDATDSDLTQVFFELYRAMGGKREDVDATGRLTLNLKPLKDAWDWIRRVDPGIQSGREKIEDISLPAKLLQEGGPAAAVSFSQPIITTPQNDKADFEQFIAEPVMGIWILAIRKKCSEPERAEAYKFVRELATNQRLATVSSKAGNVPPLVKFSDVGLDLPFWQDASNRARISACLARAKPRPRSILWREIEQELGALLTAKDFAHAASKLKNVRLEPTKGQRQ